MESYSNKRNNPYKKRKGNKRFISNAKGFGKKGIYGRGNHIEENQFSYYFNILSSLKNELEDTEEKVTMSDNVLEQTIDQEIYLSGNQVVSQVIESLLAFASPVHFERFIETFSKDLRPLCSNIYHSHVLQKLVEVAFLRSVAANLDKIDTEEEPLKKKLKTTSKEKISSAKDFNLKTKFETKHREICGGFVLKMGKFLLNNLEEFICDPYANHITRTVIQALSGIYHEKVSRKTIDANEIDVKNVFSVPLEWHEVVKEFANRLQLWPQFSELPFNELSSVLLGNLCVSLSIIDKNLLKHFGKKILVESFLKANDDDKKEIVKINSDKDVDEETEKDKNRAHLPAVFQSVPAIRLLETLLKVAGKKLFTQLYAMLFTGRIKNLASEAKTNFAVQRLIENIQDKSDFETIFMELIDNIEELLQFGNVGVVYTMSIGCLNFQVKQAAYITGLQKALHLLDSKEKLNSFFICLINLKPYEHVNFEEKSDQQQFPVNLHGSLIIQNILKFNKPISLVNCILTTKQSQLVKIFSSTNGSYIVDAFVESKFIGEKSREKLINHLEGFYIDLATTKFGSRVLEKLFDVASDSQKNKIAKELCNKHNLLNSVIFGKIIYSKFNLATYRLSPKQWKVSKACKA